MNKDETIEILVVDDNEDDVIMIQEAVEEARLLNLMHVVHDGQEAMTFLRRQAPFQDARAPGLVLLDINMPKMNGFEVLKEMKTDPALRHIPVVMLTTSHRDEDIVKSYADGACSYIPKPVDFNSFQEVAKQFSLYWALVSKIPSTAA